ncbi:hypothetical protein ACHQM5_021787 [Ranunculus cassubicifolius]
MASMASRVLSSSNIKQLPFKTLKYRPLQHYNPSLPISPSPLCFELHQNTSISIRASCTPSKDPTFLPQNQSFTEWESREELRNWLKSFVGILELLRLFHIPKLVAITVLACTSIWIGAADFFRFSLAMYKVIWCSQMFCRDLSLKKKSIFSVPRESVVAMRRGFENMFVVGGKIGAIGTKFGWRFLFLGILITMRREYINVGSKVAKIVGGDLDEIDELKKKHSWIDTFAYISAFVIMEFIDLGVKMAMK